MSDFLTDDDSDETPHIDRSVIEDSVNDSEEDGTQSLLKPRLSESFRVARKKPPPILSSDSEVEDSEENDSSESECAPSPPRKSPIVSSPNNSKPSRKLSNSSMTTTTSPSRSSKSRSKSTPNSTQSPKSALQSPKSASKSPKTASSPKVASKSPRNALSETGDVSDSDKSSDQSVHSLYEGKSEQEEDVLNLSEKMKSSRISSQFQPGQGILNSTTVDFEQENRIPGNLEAIRERDKSSSLEIIESDEDDVVEVSSEIESSSPVKSMQGFKGTLQNPVKVNQQRTLMSFGVKRELATPAQLLESSKPTTDGKVHPTTDRFKRPEPIILNSQFKPPAQKSVEPGRSDVIGVSPSELESQRIKVRQLETDLTRINSMLKTVNLEALSDKGQLLKGRHAHVKSSFEMERTKLLKMVVTKADPPKPPRPGFANWEEIKAGAENVMPKTFGKTAMSTYNEQKALTLDRLQQLHEAIKSAPKESELAEDPKGIKVPLMPHQKRALAWLIYREKEKPSGGILADDMGLGKTLTMISLIVKSLDLEQPEEDQENQYEGKNVKYKGGTLVVCPASLLNQWSGEIDRRLKKGLISYDVFHGTKRENKAKKLADYDVVITTYATANVECNKNGVLSRIKWRRIILDEAHQIRNHKAQTSIACCSLAAKSRWALTGTPLHNKELDMYALLKFLRCTPFDDLVVWKKWVSSAQERLHTVISSLMLRRTKVELMEQGALDCMPSKEWILVNVKLDPEEMGVYHKVLIFSRTLFTQFLHQRAEKNQDVVDQQKDLQNNDPNGEYFKMRQKLLKLNKVRNVSSHEILVLLTRLRQICCHCSLITAMLDGEQQDLGSGDEECEEMNLLDQLKKLNIDEDEDDAFNPSSSGVADGLANDEKVTLKEASKGLLNPAHPVFHSDRRSSKIKVIIKVLKEKVLDKDDKAILVSQWPSYLRLVSHHLKEEGIVFDQLDGSVAVPKRMEMVNRFNDPKEKVRVLLLSLTAGGVGLNLVGANHLFLLDLHWNPQLENQAQDRIYRVGQLKPVFVYKFLANDTIEERIKALQDKKLAMAEGMLTGTKQVMSSKLTMDDLKMIFGVGAPPQNRAFGIGPPPSQPLF